MAADTLMTDREIVTKALREIMAKYHAPQEPFRTLSVFDDVTGNYLLMDEGWEGEKRVHRIWAHVELRDNKFWIHEDLTEEGIVTSLLSHGVSQQRIVLAFHSKMLREISNFAVA
jgi:hypothetical protein